MRLFRRRATFPAAGERETIKRFGRLRSAAAAFAMFALAAPGISLARPVTFRDAAKNPALRQQYLDGLHKSWDSGCVKAIIYDPRGVKSARMMRSILRELHEKGLDKSISEEERKALQEKNLCLRADAFTLGIKSQIGDGKKKEIFVCPSGFRKSKEEFLSMVQVHEKTHACDLRNGFFVRGRHIKFRKLTVTDEELLHFIVETRAYGNQLRAVPPGEWINKRYIYNSISHTFQMVYSSLKAILEHKDDGRPRMSDAARSLAEETLKDYKPVCEELKKRSFSLFVKQNIEAEKKARVKKKGGY